MNSPGWKEWAVAAAVFACGLWVFTRSNGFPAHYHPDEPSKVRQVMSGNYNFHHPLLLIRTAEMIAAGGEGGPGSVVLAGRTASAIFAAGAAAALSLAGAALAGPAAGALAGLLVIANPQFVELAHYMKEDPALAFGIALAVLFFLRAWQAGTTASMVWLGVACGVAVSAKYAGAIAWILPLMAAKRCRCPMVSLSACAAAGLAVAILINWPALGAWRDFSAGLTREAGFVVGGHKGLTRSVPHGVYAAVFREATNPALWILLAGMCAGLVRSMVDGSWRRRGAEPALAVFLAIYVLVLSFSPKTHHRYFLPVTGILLMFAAVQAVRWLEGARWRAWAGAGLGLAALAWSAVESAQVLRAFTNDSRLELIQFLEAHVPDDALIVQDKRVGLTSRSRPRPESTGREIPHTVEGRLFAADVGSLDSLREKGEVFVAVSEGDFGRFFLPTHRPRDDVREDFDRRKAFYEELFKEGELVWSRPAGRLPYLQPDLRLYRLPPALDSGAP